jgi:PAS domain S-box-containing protein
MSLDVTRKELSVIKETLNESHRGMTIMEISKAVGLNRHSVAKYLEVLVAAGQVDMRSFGPSKIFSISQRVPIAAMLSFSSDLIITLDDDLCVRYVNEKFLEFMGRDRDAIIRKNVQTFSRYLQTEPPMMPYITSALAGKEGSVDIFYQGVAKRYHFILKALPTVFEDGKNGATLIMSDITARVEAEEALREERGELEIRVKERTAELETEISRRISYENALRESEEKYRNRVESVNDIVWEMGRDARFTYVSPKVRDILGFGPEHYVGHVISEFMPPEDVPEFSGGFRRIFANPRPYSFEYFRMIHRDGRFLSFEVNGSPFYDEKGQFLGFQGVTRDITGRNGP